MTRFAFLVAAFALFNAVGPLVGRASTIPPRWRIRLGVLALAGMLVAAVSLLAAVLLPEVLVASSIGQIWRMCTAAFRAISSHPLGRWPSIVAGALLAVILGRFVWALFAGARATRRSRVRACEPRWLLSGGEHVYVLPLAHPEAYSVGGFRGQVVITRGLLEALDDDERRAVLLHEEGHLRSRHHACLAVARAARAALAPLPPVRPAIERLEQAIEEAADEYAAAKLGSAATVASGLSKAALAELRSPVGALSIASGHDVPARVRRLLATPRVPGWVPLACLLGLGLLVGVIAATQVIAGFAVVAAAHHLLGVGAVVTCPLAR
ncbi:MAG: M48 family metalloprotease [Actinomycetota bacterium]